MMLTRPRAAVQPALFENTSLAPAVATGFDIANNALNVVPADVKPSSSPRNRPLASGAVLRGQVVHGRELERRQGWYRTSVREPTSSP
jgi:hypothetical protein